MQDKASRSLEIAFETFAEDIAPYLPSSGDKRKALQKIAEVSLELLSIKQSLPMDPFLKNAAQRYFGLDPLKITGLNLAAGLEVDEHRFASLYLQLTHNLILANILRLRVAPGATRKLQTHFSPAELAHFPAAKLLMENLEVEMERENGELQEVVSELRKEYELFLFVESSHEAARSFGAQTPNIREHHPSWVAFAQFLTGLAVHVHESEKAELIRQSHKIEAKRSALFESCSQLFSEYVSGKNAKKIKRQLRSNLTEIKKLEVEIEGIVSQLSVPGLHDYASFIMKKDLNQSTTFERNNISQSTGEKT